MQDIVKSFANNEQVLFRPLFAAWWQPHIFLKQFLMFKKAGDLYLYEYYIPKAHAQMWSGKQFANCVL